MLLMQFTQARHELTTLFSLLISTMDQMLPYFFTAHKNYYAHKGLFSATHLPGSHLKLNNSFFDENKFFITWKGFGMTFHQTSSLKLHEWSETRAQVASLETHKIDKIVSTLSYIKHAVITLTGDLQIMTEENSTPKQVHKEE